MPGFTKGMDTQFIIHVATEIVVIAVMAFWLNRRINKIEEEVYQLTDTIKKYDMRMAQYDSILRQMLGQPPVQQHDEEHNPSPSPPSPSPPRTSPSPPRSSQQSPPRQYASRKSQQEDEEIVIESDNEDDVEKELAQELEREKSEDCNGDSCPVDLKKPKKKNAKN